MQEELAGASVKRRMSLEADLLYPAVGPAESPAESTAGPTPLHP